VSIVPAATMANASGTDEANVAEAAEVHQMEKMLPFVQEIGGMVAADQFVRLTFMDMRKSEALSAEERAALDEAIGAYIDRVDEANTARLKELLKKVSWAELADIKPDIASDAWTIVQHSDDTDFQLKTLEDIKPLVLKGKMHGSAYANMFDRIAKRQGRKQTYGTQSACENGQIVSYEIEDTENVDARRKSLGLEPLEDYLQQLRDMYSPC